MWKIEGNSNELQQKIAEQSIQLKTVFDKQEKLAGLRQELSQLVTEQKYFNQYVEESNVAADNIRLKKKLLSKHWMVLWQECRYALNPSTHLDFLIYNRIGKKPVLAIEVDGYEYHNEDTVQASRDLCKNHIMELYEIPLLRFKTNGSGEREKIVEMLDMLAG